MDFSNPLHYPPAAYAGIVVVRIPGRLRLPALERALGQLEFDVPSFRTEHAKRRGKATSRPAAEPIA